MFKKIVVALAVTAISATPAVAAPGNYYKVHRTTGIALVPGTTDIGLHCGDCGKLVNLPFTVTFYGGHYNRVYVSTKGDVLFAAQSFNWQNRCLPANELGPAAFANWDDLRTDNTGGGIFTVQRFGQFFIEWRAWSWDFVNYKSFEVALSPNVSKPVAFIYGSLGNNGADSTAGVQSGTGLGSTQITCNPGRANAVLKPGFKYQFVKS
jgi:hypothetical protein